MTDQGAESRPVPTITVIVPTLDSAGTIAGCLESLASQTYPDFEVLIQDGLSADATVEIVEAFGAAHPQLDIHVHRERDGGVYHAMNKALDRARGEWILFLGSDDRLFAADTLERTARCLTEDRDVVYGDVVSPVFGGRYAGRVSIRGMLDSNICHQAILVRRRLYDRVGRFDVRFRILSDWEHNMRWFLSPDVRVAHVDEVIATFGDRGLSSTGVDPVFHREQRLLYLEHGRHSLPPWLKIRIAAREAVAAAVRCDLPHFLRAVRAWSAVLAPRKPIHR
jgi:glycosyltransferase involved in cell wall biosynthesis